MLATSTTWIFFLDRGWGAWNGWTSVAAIAQALAAFGTLAALIFFWLQFMQIRRQAADEKANQRAQMEVIRGQLQVGREQSKHIEGIAGVAYFIAGLVFGGFIATVAHAGKEEWTRRRRGSRRVQQ